MHRDWVVIVIIIVVVVVVVVVVCCLWCLWSDRHVMQAINNVQLIFGPCRIDCLLLKHKY